MKTAPAALLAPLLLLLMSSLSATPSLADPVLDTAGNALRPSLQYYIAPAVTDVAGSTTLAGRNGSCPLSVVLASAPGEKGLPVRFVLADDDVDEDEIELDEDVNVVPQAGNDACGQSTVWRIERNEGDRRIYVVAGGEIGNPGRETLGNWFSIREYQGDYQIVYCPSVCEICRPVCGSIGVYEDGGRLWLGVSDVPSPFVFERA